ncbi:MAG: 1,4-dihydroxy-2-naphthoate octaprenyltransferase [Flavobacteriaceae bacterium]
MVKSFIQAARLRTLPLSISGIILAGFLAEYTGYFRWDILILSLLTTVAFQVISNFANDYGDGVKGTDNEDRIGPERAIQSGAISPAQMKKAIKISSAIGLLLSVVLIYVSFGKEDFLWALFFLLLGIASIWAAIKYTVGDDAYGYSGKGDIFVFLFFGGLSVLGGYFLYHHDLDLVFSYPAASIGLLSTAVLNLNNMRDRSSDIKAGKNTLVVQMGFQRAKVYHSILIILPLIFSLMFNLYLGLTDLKNFIYLIAFIPLLLNLSKVWKVKDPVELDPELKKVALGTFLYSVLFGISILL